MTDTRTHMHELVAVAAPSWAGEAEIVRTYLSAHRTVERDLVWLRAQAWKETRVVRVLTKQERDAYFSTGATSKHPEGIGRKKFGEEVKHFRLIADLIAEITGAAIDIEDLEELAEETKLQAMRAPYRRGTRLERAIVDFTEGGGCAMYAVLGELGGSELDRHIAAVFREIYDDEIFHGPAEILVIARHARGPGDWARARDIVRQMCRLRLSMRNEMFSAPLSDARLDEIAAGKIEPWPIPLPL